MPENDRTTLELNARIDDAPDLLAACEAVAEWWNVDHGEERFPADVLEAAIAKARGEQ